MSPTQTFIARLDKGVPIPGPPGPPGPIIPATTTTIGAVIIGANVNVQANGTISTPMASVFGRTGAVVAASGDYTAAKVTNAVDTTQTYANPPWITSLAWTKITGVPVTGVSSVFTRSGAVVAAAGDYTAAQVTNAVSVVGSYADPAWITALAWGKITGAPTVSSYQTPWLSDIDGAGKALNNARGIRLSGADTTNTNPSFVLMRSTLGNSGNRWQMILLGGESGANTGADLGIVRYDDTGAFLTTPLSINRATGVVSFGVMPTVLGASIQTPWATDIDAANHQLTNVSAITVSTGVSPTIYVNNATDMTAIITSGIALETGAKLRWLIVKGGTESGANAGAFLRFNRYDDAGVSLGTVLQISRTTGVADFALMPTVGGASIQTPWLSDVSAAGKALTNIKALYINGADNTNAFQPGLNYQILGVSRWASVLYAPETGSQTGSNWALSRYNDAGAFVNAPIAALRSSGLVGINNLNPAYQLDVTGDLNITGVYRIGGVALPGNPWTVDVNASGHQLINLDALLVNSGPNRTILVQSATNDTYTISPLLTSWQTGSFSRWAIQKNGAESSSNAGSNLRFIRYDDGGGVLGFPFFITRSNGFVGINNTAPQYQLDVVGNANIAGALGTTSLQTTSLGVGAALPTASIPILVSSTGATYGIRVDGTGNVSYSLLLAEHDPTKTAGILIQNDLGSAPSGGGMFVGGSNHAVGVYRNNLIVYTQADLILAPASTERMRLTAAGDMVLPNVKTTVPTVGSNIVYKDASGFLKIA